MLRSSPHLPTHPSSSSTSPSKGLLIAPLVFSASLAAALGLNCGGTDNNMGNSGSTGGDMIDAGEHDSSNDGDTFDCEQLKKACYVDMNNPVVVLGGETPQSCKDYNNDCPPTSFVYGGACTVRRSPGFSDSPLFYTSPDQGYGYDKINKGQKFLSFNEVKNTCTQADYDALGQLFCDQNPGDSYEKEVWRYSVHDNQEFIDEGGNPPGVTNCPPVIIPPSDSVDIQLNQINVVNLPGSPRTNILSMHVTAIGPNDVNFSHANNDWFVVNLVGYEGGKLILNGSMSNGLATPFNCALTDGVVDYSSTDGSKGLLNFTFDLNDLIIQSGKSKDVMVACDTTKFGLGATGIGDGLEATLQHGLVGTWTDNSNQNQNLLLPADLSGPIFVAP